MRIHFFTASFFAITKQAASKEAAEKRKLKARCDLTFTQMKSPAGTSRRAFHLIWK